MTRCRRKYDLSLSLVNENSASLEWRLITRGGGDGPGGARRLFAVPLFDIMDKIVGFNRWIAWGVLMEGEEGYAAPRKGQE